MYNLDEKKKYIRKCTINPGMKIWFKNHTSLSSFFNKDNQNRSQALNKILMETFHLSTLK